MGAFKAPGPDGFPAFFYQRFRSLVKDSFCQMALSVLGGQSLLQGLNETYITLIPKIPHPQLASQFRPISLCNVCYKLITKVIVQRLKNILPELVAPTQTSFVLGRQIGDNIVIMQEILHTMRKMKGKTGWMAIKIDLEKAYAVSYTHLTLPTNREV